MILHPVVSEISSRRDRLIEAVAKGHLTPELTRYARPGWAYILKETGTPTLAYPSVGNYESEADGAITYVITTDDEDRDGDIVRPMGCQLKNYSKNPVVFFGHREKPIPIGVCRSPDGRITVFPEENRVLAAIHFDREDPDADFIYGKCRRKVLNATSVAFVPIEAWRRNDVRKARQHSENSGQPGWHFNLWDMTELSVVGVPSNQNAVGLEKDLMGACRDVWDRERREMSPQLQKAWQPYVAQAKGCWGGWCPLPGDEKDIGGGVVLKAVKKSSLGKEPSVDSGDRPGEVLNTLKSADPDPEMDLAADVQKIGAELAAHTDPAPMPGYGQIFRGPDNQLWYVGGDGDEDGFVDLVQEKLQPLTAGEVTYEAETFPPEDEGWEQLYPEQKLHKACSCDDCAEGKACGCVKKSRHPFDVKQSGENWFVYDGDEKVGGPFESRMAAEDFAAGLWREQESGAMRAEKAKAPQKYQVGQKVDVGGSMEDAEIIRVVGYVRGSWMYQIEYHVPGDPPGKRHQQPWMENQIRAKAGKRAVGKSASKGLVHTRSKGASEARERLVQAKFDDTQLRRIVREEPTVERALERAEREVRTGSWYNCRTSGGGEFERIIEPLVRRAYSEHPEKSMTQADLDSPGVPGRSTNPEEKPAKALSQSDGRVGGYAVPPENLDDTQPPGWAACEGCHGSGSCEACGGTGTFGGEEECPECGGSGECGECAGEGHVEKQVCMKSRATDMAGKAFGEGDRVRTPNGPGTVTQIEVRMIGSNIQGRDATVTVKLDSGKTARFSETAINVEKSARRKQLDQESPKPSAPQVLAALYSHAKAEATYLDGLGEEHKGSLADYRRQQVEERMDMLKYQFSRAAGEEDDLEKMCKDFEQEHDKAIDYGVEPGEAGLVEQGQVPPPEEEEPQLSEKQRRKGRTMKQNQVPAEGAYVEDEPFDKAAPGTDEWAEEEEAKAHTATQSGELDARNTYKRDPSDTHNEQELRGSGRAYGYKGQELEEYVRAYINAWRQASQSKAVEDEELIEEPIVEEKASGGVCMCGMEVPDGASECPGCGAPVEKTDEVPVDEGEALLEDKDVVDDPVVEEVASPPEAAVTDPSAEEILERYQHPKSHKWATRKWLVNKSLLPFLKHRVAANGRKYLVRAKQAEKPKEELDDDEVKSLTTKLAGAIDDLKSLVRAKDLPRQYKAGLKHVADQIWYVGKALTDKGKEQKNGGSGSELSDKGKEQRDGGKGSELSDKGEQQGKTPTKGHRNGRPVSAAVEKKFLETMAKVQRFGVFNGG